MLIIAPRNMHLDIINYYRKDNPFFDIKVVDKNDLIEATGYFYSSDIITHILKNYDYSYDEIITYLTYLKKDFIPTSKKLEKLKDLQTKLIIEGMLYKSEVSKLLFLNKHALVVGYSSYDNELICLSKLLDMKLEYYEYPASYKVNKFYSFSRLEDEVYYVLNEIAHDIDLGVDINDIYIFNRSEEYLYYLKTFSPLFGFHINYPNSISMNKLGVYSEFKRLYEASKDLQTSLIELEKVCLNDDYYIQFVEAINKLKIDDLPYELESIYLDKKLKETYIAENKYLSAVNLISEPTLLSNKKIYVLGFIQGQFPKSKKDDNYLNEVELKSLNKLTNKLETKIDQDNILNFFKLDNEYVVSFSYKSLQNAKMISSPILGILGLDKKQEDKNPFKNYFYSLTVLKYIACHYKDMNVLYNENSDKYLATKDLIRDTYLTYDNSFKGARVYRKDSPLKLSTTQLSDYANCPFKYYLGRILNVDPFEETTDSVFGQIVHTLLEHSLLDDSYDVNKHYDQLVNESNVSEEIKILWSLSLKDQIVNMVRYIKLHNRYMTNAKIELEKEIDINLDELTILTGKIDKLVLLDNKYLIMIDYKTGSSGDFDETYLKDGLSSQLPTYALLAKESSYSKYSVTGLYINHIFTKDKEIEIKEDELIPSYLKLSGKSIDNYASFFAFDNTISSGKSSFVKSISCKEDTLVSRSNCLVSKEKLDEYIEIVRNKYLEVSNLIRDNKFDIYPIDKMGQFRACQNCSFKDICYVREKQVHYLYSEETTTDE